jgi:hypothetical protein
VQAGPRVAVPKALDRITKVVREAAQFAVKIRRVLFVECTKQTTQVVFLSFPLFRLSKSDQPPADPRGPHAEGDTSVSLIARDHDRVTQGM